MERKHDGADKGCRGGCSVSQIDNRVIFEVISRMATTEASSFYFVLDAAKWLVQLILQNDPLTQTCSETNAFNPKRDCVT